MRVFVSGPMTGLSDYNLPAFEKATAQLDEAGYIGVNPGSRGVIPGYTHAEYMRDSIRLLLDCDGVAVLEGWTKSRGAVLEVGIAEGIGIRVMHLEDWLIDAEVVPGER